MTPKVRDFVAAAFYTVPEVQVLFAFRDARQVYRAATSGFLRPYARRFQARHLVFERRGIDKLIESGGRT